MKRALILLVIQAAVSGCETTTPNDAIPSTSIPYAEPLTFVSVNGTPPLIGQPFARQFSAVGGRPPYRWSLTDGAVAAGLTLSSGGLLTGTTRDPASYSYSVTVTDAEGNTGGSTFFGRPNRTGKILFTLGPIALRVVGQGGEAGYQPFLQGGTPPFAFSATGLPPGLTIDRATGFINGRASKVGDYTVSVTVQDATGTVAEGSPSVASVLVVPPEEPAGNVDALARYAGTWTGIFSLQYAMCPSGYGVTLAGDPCDRFVGLPPVAQFAPIETGVVAVKISLTVEGNGPRSAGFASLVVKKVTLSHPAFHCQSGCTPEPGSVLVLQDPGQTGSTIGGMGLFIVGPNHAFSISTANAAGAVRMSPAGATQSNALDPGIRENGWNGTIGEESFEGVVLPRLLTQPEARVTQASWVLSKGAL